MRMRLKSPSICLGAAVAGTIALDLGLQCREVRQSKKSETGDFPHVQGVQIVKLKARRTWKTNGGSGKTRTRGAAREEPAQTH